MSMFVSAPLGENINHLMVLTILWALLMALAAVLIAYCALMIFSSKLEDKTVSTEPHRRDQDNLRERSGRH